MDALRAEVQSLASRVAYLTCSDREVIVTGMLEAEGRAVRQDRRQGTVLSDSAGHNGRAQHTGTIKWFDPKRGIGGIVGPYPKSFCTAAPFVSLHK